MAEPAAHGGLCLELCGSGRGVGPGGPEDAECLWARCAGCMERRRCACPGSWSCPPGAVMPPRLPGGFVWFLLLPSPFLPPPFSPPLPAHSLGCCETSPLLRSRLPAAASSEHLCFAFNGPLLLSLLLSARVVDVVGSVL